MKRVTMADLKQNLEAYLDQVQREPINVIRASNSNGVILISETEYLDYLEFKNGRLAYHGDVSEEFRADVDKIMDEHAEVLEGLSK